ncbi:MAG: helix-turn-helix domain-containing protein [Thermoplasmata archaeon]
MGRRAGSQTRPTEVRIAAVRLVRAGVPQKAVAEAFEVHPSTVSRWCRLARTGGLNALARRPVTGRPPKLSPAALKELPRLLETPPSTLGFPARRWSLALVSDLIRRRYGVAFHPSHVGRVLRSLNVKLIN